MRISRRQMIRLTSGISAAALLSPAQVFEALAAGSIPVEPTPDSAATVAVRWNNLALQGARTGRIGPPMVARALAIVHTAIYDAWAAYHPIAVGTRLGGFLRRPASEHTLANKDRAISYAAFLVLNDLFPSQIPAYRQAMAGMGYDPDETSIDIHTPTGIGRVAAQALLEYRHGDGSNQLGDLHPGAYSDYTGYIPANTPDTISHPSHWQPLRISDGHGGSVVQQYIAPHWGLVTPFALTPALVRQAIGPARFPSKAYLQEVNEVLYWSAHLTDRRKVIAEYWADGPSSELPPGHWCLFAQLVCRRDGHNLDKDVRLFFALGNALLDASIACWGIKRAFDSVRPITAVHYVYAHRTVKAWAGPGMGTAQIQGSAWQPYQPATVVTPAFPEYTSGHSTFSAAGAEVLRLFTGSDVCGGKQVLSRGSSRVEPGQTPARDITLSWPTFTAAANQAGISRRYGGIHFRDGDLTGRELGRRIGAESFRAAQRYIAGTIH